MSEAEPGVELAVSNEASKRERSLSFEPFNRAPSTIYYRAESNTLRPELSQLLHGEGVNQEEFGRVMTKRADEQKKPGKNLFGTFEGVFARCLLNIWGVLMFLRLGWIVGHAGIWESCLIVLCCMAVTIITTTSLSAICTNGEVQSGGAYFMISRALGPEFGGSIGILFALANAGAVALHLIGFAETVIAIFPEGFTMTPEGVWDLRVVAILTLIFLISIGLVGVSWVVRFQLGLLFLLTASLFSYIIGTFLEEIPELGFTGFMASTWAENSVAEYRDQSWFSLFAIFFPASTGIMAGANISGDLRNPAVSIPLGTMSAVFVSGIVYFILIFLIGATCIREVDPLISGTNGTITDGLVFNYNILIESSASPTLIVLGIFAAGLSSALAALVGAPRVFQAVCADELFPVLNGFAHGVGPNNEPIRAYILTFIIAVGFICIGELNAVAPYITNFFLISYALINYSCFVSPCSNAPGWRPSFTRYNRWVSLFGAFVCVALMFLIDYKVALTTMFVGVMLYWYVQYSDPDVNWGSAGQAALFQKLYRLTTQLERSSPHVKIFRPSFLFLPFGSLEQELPLVQLVSEISKPAKGLLCCGQVLIGDFRGTINELRRLQNNPLLRRHKIKGGILSPIIAASHAEGFRTLLQSAGLGKLRPNTLVMRFPETWQTNPSEAELFVETVRNAFFLGLGAVILRHPKTHAPAEKKKQQKLTKDDTPSNDIKETKEEKGSKDDEATKENKDGETSTVSKASDTSTAKDDDTSTASKASDTSTASKDDDTSTASKASDMPSEQPTIPSICERKGRIDVYWLNDDGGLTVLIPDLLTKHPLWKGSHVRVLVTGGIDDVAQNTAVPRLLGKLRIKATTDVMEAVKHKEPSDPSAWTDLGLDTKAYDNYAKLHTCVGEVVAKTSHDAQLVVLSLPVPRMNISADVYCGWIQVASKIAETVPVLLVQGSGQVVTFYS